MLVKVAGEVFKHSFLLNILICPQQYLNEVTPIIRLW